MKKLLLIALAVKLVLAVHAQSPDEKSIQSAVVSFEQAFNAKDAKATARFWAEDGEFVTYRGDLLTGRQAVETYFRNTFTQFYPTAKNNLSAPTVRFLKPDVAAVDVKWEVTGRTDAEGKELSPMKGIMVWTHISTSHLVAVT